MELLYVYIDNFRVFKKQEVTFSNKFIVEFDPETLNLTINSNDNYLNIYPGNIVGINAILGKNAAGKSSLIELIGDRIENRKNNVDRQENYLLIYYCGKNSDSEDVFVMETNSPEKYVKIFANYNVLTDRSESGHPSDLEYYESKGWMSVVFSVNNGELIYQDDSQNYREMLDVDNKFSIITFKEQYRDSNWHSRRKDDETKISIKRRLAFFKGDYYLRQINFLIRQMSNKNNCLYKDSVYYVEVVHKSSYSQKFPGFSINQQIQSSFSEPQKYIINFLNEYMEYAFDSLISQNEKRNEDDYIKDLSEVLRRDNSYDSCKEYYYNLLKCIFNALSVEYDIVAEFKASVASLESFAFGFPNIHFEKNKIIFEITDSSDLSPYVSFFNEIVDETNIKNNSGRDVIPLMNSFVSASIKHLSDGEQANLNLFSNIDEYISEHTAEKTDYIILLDEIEKSMHPDMCRNLISYLILLLNQYDNKRFHIIISSHSPFIVGDIIKENIICLERDYENCVTKVYHPEKETMGQNIHSILKNEFFLDYTYGEYGKNFILNLSEWLKSSVAKARDLINNYYNKEFILQDSDVAPFLEKSINKVGEPLIRSQLNAMFNYWVEENFSKEDKINYYMNKIAELNKMGE